MQIVFFDCQPDACLNSLTASLFSAGLNFDDWHESVAKAAQKMELNTEITVGRASNQSIQVQKLALKCLTRPPADAVITAQEALDRMERCGCEESVKNLSRTIFTRLLECESKVRGIKLSDLKLGQILLEETLLQIIGFALAYRAMKIDNVFCAPLPLASGQSLSSFKISAHEFSSQTTDFLMAQAAAAIKMDGTGLSSAVVASVLTTVVGNWSMPAFSALRQVGYGCSDASNSCCRVLVGDMQSARFRSEVVSVLEANLDDLSPQVLSFASEQLLAEGALDVFITSAIMKKGRSGHLLTVLCNVEDIEKMQSIIFAQTSTLGVRSHDCERRVAEREFEMIALDDEHTVRIKIGFDLQGNVVNAQPEYEDCASFARFSGQSIQQVMQIALAKFKSSSAKYSVLIAVLFTCFFSLAAFAKSPASVPTSPDQFGHVLRQAHGGTLKSDTGFEIYSWNVGGKWHYSILPASKEEKTYSEVTNSSVTRKSFIELETALGKLAPCVVTWHNHVLKENGKSAALSMPHQVVINQLKKYCQTRQLKLEL